MASKLSLPAGKHGLLLQTNHHLINLRLQRPAGAASRNARRNSGVLVQAIAAPEKKTEEVPFTAWDTAVQRVAKRDDLKTIMILGAGPIIIGQVRKIYDAWFDLACSNALAQILICSRILKRHRHAIMTFNTSLDSPILLQCIAGLRIRLFRHSSVQSPQVRCRLTALICAFALLLGFHLF